MSAEVSGDRVSGNGTGEVTRLRADILATRAELGRTVEALAAKADLPARVRQGTDQAKTRVRESVRDAAYHPVPWLAVCGGAAVLILLVVLRRRLR